MQLARRFAPVPLALLLAASALLLVAAPPVSRSAATAAEPLPAQISDDAFWHMVSGFSEDGGYFRFENFLSNEIAFQWVIPELKETTKPGGVYMGVGPEQNFTYVAALQPNIAFIIDIRRQNMIEHMIYKALFELSPDRTEFLSRLFCLKKPSRIDPDGGAEALFRAYATVQPDRNLFRKNLQEIQDLLVKQHKFGLNAEDLSSIEYVYRVFFEAGPYLDYSFGGGVSGQGTPTYGDLMTATDQHGVNRSYLASEENYQIVRDMEKKNLIVPLVGDFAGAKVIRTVGQYLKDHNATVTAFYLSNVEQYLFMQGTDWQRFFRNVETLPLDSSSTFIRTVNGGMAGFGGFGGIRFQTLLGSMTENVKAVKEGRIRAYYDVVEMSH
jgi:hypothetical protein